MPDVLELGLRLAVGGGIVVGLILLWRHATRAGVRARGGPSLRVVGRAGLMRNCLVAVVDVEGQRFLVGAAESSVRLLADLGHVDDEAPSKPFAADVHDPPPTTITAAIAAADAHGQGVPTDPGPRIGPLDRLRGMTVRSHAGEPIRVHTPDLD